MKKFLSDYFYFNFLEKQDHIDILAWMSGVFLVTTIIIFKIILIRRIIGNIKTRRRKIIEEKAQQIILSYLFDDEQWDYTRFTNIRKKHLSNKFRCEIFMDSIIKLQINLIGKSAERLKSLYIGLRLHRKSLEKLKSSLWNVSAKGIIELAEMDMREYLGEIRSFINHGNPILRSEAQIALIQLENANPFAFLNQLNEPIHDWQQSQLAHVSEQLDKALIPDFYQWLDNKEDSVVIFCIRMISLHGQINASQKLIRMLKDPQTSENVRGAIIFAIRQLDLTQTAAYLKKIYKNENLYNKQEIQKTVSMLNTDGLDEKPAPLLYEKEEVATGQFYPDTTVFIPKGDLIEPAAV